MKMTDVEFNKFREASESIQGLEVLLCIAEQYPSKLSDDETIAIFGTLKKLITPVTTYMQAEISRQDK
ncbi:hypothetical protein ERHA54_35330 [Erwinia rhapontici]|uniref:hypothetical protein n=1 Tax=Erwinia rhapontici TaxID=55212 RepID=UPI001BB4490A|nr:hypothetical protein [Erwinia rhapontici]BCQ40930.1 hypothetical protein ERHA54_35330 [Erwinia rhapontici]